MTWCRHCDKNSQTHRDYTTGNVCCVDCGLVVSQDIYIEDVTIPDDVSQDAYTEDVTFSDDVSVESTWCPHCARNSKTRLDYTTGHVCCVNCGIIASQDIYTDDVTFVKDTGGWVETTWCSHCAKNSKTFCDYSTCNESCADCGKLLYQHPCTDDFTFVKDAGGWGHLAGNLAKMEIACTESDNRNLEKDIGGWVETIWCSHCVKNSETYRDNITCSESCVDCGKLLFQDPYTDDFTYVKDEGGSGHLACNLAKMEIACSESDNRTLEKEVKNLPQAMSSLTMDD